MARLLLVLLVWFGASLPAAAVGTAFTYQGSLKLNGQPGNGLYDFQFVLLDERPAQVGPTVLRQDVPVAAGLFAVELDFGVNAFPGAERLLRISVRPSSGRLAPFTTLAPDTLLRAAPYAQHANTAANATRVAAGAVGTAELAGNAVTGAQVQDGSLSAADVDASLQRRVSGTCPAGQAIRAVAQDGQVACEPGVPGSVCAAGFPLLGYATGNALCDNARNQVPHGGLAGVNIPRITGTVDSNGLPWFAVLDSDPADIGLYRCRNAACATLQRGGMSPVNGDVVMTAFGNSVYVFYAGLAGGVPDGHIYLHLCDIQSETCTDRMVIFNGAVGAAALKPLAASHDANGNVLIAYLDGDRRISLYRCTDPQCVWTNGGATLDASTDTGNVFIHRKSNGLAVIVFGANNRLRVRRCGNLSCDTAGATTGDITSSGGTSFVALQGSSNPPMLFTASGGVGFRRILCNDHDCFSTSTIALGTSSASPSGAWMKADGRPSILQNGGVFECSDPSCGSASFVAFGESRDSLLALRPGNRPLLANRLWHSFQLTSCWNSPCHP